MSFLRLTIINIDKVFFFYKKYLIVLIYTNFLLSRKCHFINRSPANKLQISCSTIRYPTSIMFHDNLSLFLAFLEVFIRCLQGCTSFALCMLEQKTETFQCLHGAHLTFGIEK